MFNISKKTRRTGKHRMTAYTACIALRGKNRHFYVARPSFFVCPGDAPVAITQNVAWMKRQLSACQTPRSMYSCIFNSFPVIPTLVPKIAVFTYRSPVFPLETPLPLSRNMLHGCKDNSMPAKPLAACTHLSSIVNYTLFIFYINFVDGINKNKQPHRIVNSSMIFIYYYAKNAANCKKLCLIYLAVST